jgi:EmrB/QacA subfamily drug resistance transporter
MSEVDVDGSAIPPQHVPGPGDRLYRRRWLILAVIAIAQLMVSLDTTIMNIALPSAQRALHFSNADRQWVITAYVLAFGSLLLFGGRLSDLLGRKVTFLTGLAGFGCASAVGGASAGFTMLITARACQGAFGALLAPSALSMLTTTFSDPRERGRAFGTYGAISAGGGAIGLLLGGLLTEYLSWRWCLYVNLFFAGAGLTAGLMLLPSRGTPSQNPRLDIPGVVMVSGGMFCLVYGFSNAATHSWHTPSTWGFLAAGIALLAVFVGWQSRAASPLLPLRIVLDRNRGTAYLSVLIGSAGMFGIFLFLTYYLQETLSYSPVVTGLAFLPMIAAVMVSANVGQVILMPRVGPRPLVPAGMLLAAAGMAWLTRIGVNSGYAAAVLGPMLIAGAGFGLVIAPSTNTGTFGMAPSDAGVASASVNTSQQLGGSIGTALLNTMATTATASYIATRIGPGAIAGGQPAPQLIQLGLVHGYIVAFWWAAGICGVGALTAGALFRRGPLARPALRPGPAGVQPESGEPAVPT